MTFIRKEDIIAERNATVAQSVEQLIRNQQVAGSSPAISSRKKRLAEGAFLFWVAAIPSTGFGFLPHRQPCNIPRFVLSLKHHRKEGGVMSLQESGEMYLETILILSQKSGFVRSVDIGEKMGYSKPSVSRAVGILRQGGYIQVGKDGGITLTDSGRAVAEKIYERHRLLTRFLVTLGVEEATAAEDACKIEHVISDASFEAIKRHAMPEQ